MFRVSNANLRIHTRWRHLLHPLPRRARQIEWFKRDKTERNESILRKPYYTLKAIDPSHEAKRETMVMPGTAGPQLEQLGLQEKSHAFYPNYVETWDAVPPHTQ